MLVKSSVACPNPQGQSLSDRGWQQPLTWKPSQRRVKDAEGHGEAACPDSVRWLGYSATYNISNAAPYPSKSPLLILSKTNQSESPNACPRPKSQLHRHIPRRQPPLCCATRIARYVAAASNLASCAPAASPNIFCAKPLTSPSLRPKYPHTSLSLGGLGLPDGSFASEHLPVKCVMVQKARPIRKAHVEPRELALQVSHRRRSRHARRTYPQMRSRALSRPRGRRTSGRPTVFSVRSGSGGVPYMRTCSSRLPQRSSFAL